MEVGHHRPGGILNNVIDAKFLPHLETIDGMARRWKKMQSSKMTAIWRYIKLTNEHQQKNLKGLIQIIRNSLRFAKSEAKSFIFSGDLVKVPLASRIRKIRC